MENTGVTQESMPPIEQPGEVSQIETEPGEVQQPQEPIQQEPVQQTQEPDPASQGQLSALVAEREKRQNAEREREFYRQMAMENQQPVQQREPEYDPEDLPTYDAVNQLVDDRVGKIQDQMRSQQLIQMEAQAKTKYPDWESVVLLAEEMSRSNPGLGDAILNSANPAETAYLMGKTHDKYSQIQNQRVTSEVADKITTNLNTAPTLSNVGSGHVPDQGERWKTATSTDLEAEIARIKGF